MAMFTDEEDDMIRGTSQRPSFSDEEDGVISGTSQRACVASLEGNDLQLQRVGQSAQRPLFSDESGGEDEPLVSRRRHQHVSDQLSSAVWRID
jgi:hypothetical protein